jgi:hypothetical protein
VAVFRDVRLATGYSDVRRGVPQSPKKSIGVPIIFGRCPSLSAYESESMLRTYLACREKRERERETSKRHVGKAHSVLITANLLPQRLSCY